MENKERSVKVDSKNSTKTARAKSPSGQGLYGNVKGQSGEQMEEDKRHA